MVDTTRTPSENGSTWIQHVVGDDKRSRCLTDRALKLREIRVEARATVVHKGERCSSGTELVAQAGDEISDLAIPHLPKG